MAMCDCSKTEPRVVYFTTATWKNGKTDVQVRQNVKTKCYQVIEHCQEHVTRQTGEQGGEPVARFRR